MTENQARRQSAEISDLVGSIPYRMAFAGGWIDQPFVSKHNPDGTGSMVVAGLEPDRRYMDKCGMATSTRNVARSLWEDRLPPGPPEEHLKELYWAENSGKPEPSGSQDMAGIIYPGINRLDFSCDYEEGLFPVHVETCTEAGIIDWLEAVIWMVPVAQRPEGYNPLEMKNLDPEWIRRLGRTGAECYAAILERDAAGLGGSMNRCMECWETILPGTVRHSSLEVDLNAVLEYYQSRYTGAMYSGCGGGYLYVVSDKQVPGGFRVRIRRGR